MKLLSISLFFTFISSFCYSQKDIDSIIFNKIVFSHKINKPIYISCEKRKTHFKASRFTREINLEIPLEILKQFEVYAQFQSNEVWQPGIFDKRFVQLGFLLSDTCIDKNVDTDKIYDEAKVKPKIISISKPLYDRDLEHCIVNVQVQVSKYILTGYGYSLLFKKVYGKWIVITRFQSWIS